MALTLLVAAGLLLAADAPTPPLRALQFDGSANLYFDASGRISACGLRIFGVETVAGEPSRMRSIDVSLLVPDETIDKGVGLLKAASVEARQSAENGALGRSLKIHDGWVRADGFARTTPYQGLRIDSQDDPNAHLYLADIGSIIGIVRAAIGGSELRVGLERDGAGGHPVYHGSVTISDVDKRQLSDCFAVLLKSSAFSEEISAIP